MKSSRFFLLLATLPALFAWGCGDSSTGPDDGDNPSVTGPTVGAAYTFNVYQLSSTGQQSPNIVNSGVLRVTANNETYRGRTGVATYLREADNRISYFHTDAAGDISYYSPGYALLFGPVTPPMWLGYPTGTKGESAETLTDSTFVNEDGENERFIVKRSVKYLGEEAKSVEGKSYTAHKVWEQVTMELLDEAGETVSAQRSEGTFWYSPEIHYFLQYDAGTWLGDLDNPTLFTGSRDILVKYQAP